jgi:hypothetical protein
VDWITPQVAIGNYPEGQDPEVLRQDGIRSVLSLDGTLSPGDAGRLGLATVAGFRLIDGDGNDPRLIRLAIESLAFLLRRDCVILAT